MVKGEAKKEFAKYTDVFATLADTFNSFTVKSVTDSKLNIVTKEGTEVSFDKK